MIGGFVQAALHPAVLVVSPGNQLRQGRPQRRVERRLEVLYSYRIDAKSYRSYVNLRGHHL
jgi:hypothetical protein